MRADIEKWAYAALFSEIILEMVPEWEPHPDPFLLHKGTLDRLERDKDPQNVLLLALLRFQALMGYMPALDGCAVCGCRLRSARKWFWQPAHGKLVCESHLRPNTGCIPLDLGTLALMHYMRRIPLEKIWRLRMRREMKAPLLMGLLDWFCYHTRKEIQSIKVLDQINGKQSGRQWIPGQIVNPVNAGA
jgi:DNA repair protein RecO (recombination protein O)